MYECVFPLCESAVTHPSHMLWTFFHNILPETFSWLHTIHCMDCWILVHQFSWFCTLILSLLPKVFQKLFLMSLDTFFLTFWGFSCRWRTTESKILQNFTIFTLTLRWWTDSCHLQHRDWLVSMAAKVVKTVYGFTVVAFALSALSITSLRLRLWG